MQIIDRNLLDIPSDRQRKEIPNASLQELKESIASTVLLHAPVVQKVGERYVLVAGERRTRAIDLLAKESKSFIYNKVPIPPGSFPCVELDEAFTAIGRAEIELAENIQRVELPWQDRIVALKHIHDLRVAANPLQTVSDTAREIASGEVPGVTVGANTPPEARPAEITVRKNLTQANVIAEHLHVPAIAKARNATEAFNLIIAAEERAFLAEQIKRGAKKITSVEVRHGSLLDIMPKLDSGIVDTIFSDPPYGMNIDSAGFRSRTVHHHNYDDTPDEAKVLLSCIIHEGFRVCKPRANMFIMCDIDLFGWLKDCCGRAGWEPFRTPITWGKSDSEGMAPWGREGFRRTTEWLLFARKGQKGLFHSPIDYLRHNRVSRDEREYGPEKPVSLIKELLSASTLPGELVLDPCCGSGSTLVAARELNMRAIGIEKDLTAYNLALVKSQTERAPDPTSVEAL